jgi:hypothetical protein
MLVHGAPPLLVVLYVRALPGGGLAWVVSFGDGFSSGYGKTDSFAVRAVRGGS